MNLVRLGAEVIGYHPDFYGELRDAISWGPGDRFEVRWRLTASRGESARADAAARVACRGRPPLTADFEGVRAADPGTASLRDASREAFAALDDGRLRPGARRERRLRLHAGRPRSGGVIGFPRLDGPRRFARRSEIRLDLPRRTPFPLLADALDEQLDRDLGDLIPAGIDARHRGNRE